MARQVYNLDGARFAEEATYGTAGTTFTVDMGWIDNITIQINDEVAQARGVTTVSVRARPSSQNKT